MTCLHNPYVHLVPFIQPCMHALVFVPCVHRRIVLNMEGCAACNAGCLVYVVAYGVWVVLWVAATCYCVAGMYGPSCMQKVWGCMDEHCLVCVDCWSLSCIVANMHVEGFVVCVYAKDVGMV